ncbi:hypothetical protein RSOL_219760 [Rhizoctonia solani AG-3 Rhs1AP]|uniref:Uncharacterized protein n=2 Tax=Rhizoctonia solani AG-3 TaxID=1086053 RepID=A0A074RVK1_9AGAM|nr:hypothetical protein RSOL_219760 [Rhizoctonia solani AG-3 Rhs1AP]KEP51136.1 hypothetical protein V565_067060 [Rhizoctonia solani 123E]
MVITSPKPPSSRRTEKKSVHKNSAESGHSITLAPMDRFSSPSRIPRLIHTTPDNSVSYSPGYAAPTFASNQRQQKQRPNPRYLTPKKNGSTAFPGLPAKLLAASKIPVRSKQRIGAPLTSYTPMTIPQSLSECVSTPSLIPSSPPPAYTKRPEAPSQSKIANISPASSSLSTHSPSQYPEHTSEQEQERWPKRKPLSFLPGRIRRKGYEAPTFTSIQRQKAVSRRSAPGGRMAKTKFHGRKLKYAPSYTGAQLDDLARKILADIFSIVDSCPSAREAALFAYFQD